MTNKEKDAFETECELLKKSVTEFSNAGYADSATAIQKRLSSLTKKLTEDEVAKKSGWRAKLRFPRLTKMLTIFLGINPEVVKHLADEKNSIVEQLTASLEKGDYYASAVANRRLSLLDQGIARNTPDEKFFGWVYPVSVAVTCLVIAGILIGCRKAHLNFKAEFIARAVSFRPNKQWEHWGSLQARNITITNLSTVQSAALGLDQQGAPHFTMNVKGDSLSSLSSLVFSNEAMIELEGDSTELVIEIKNDSLNFSVSVAPAACVSLTNGMKATVTNTSDYPEELKLSTHQVRRDAARFVLQDIEPWQFHNISASALVFAAADQIDERPVEIENTLLSGVVTVLETGDVFEFQEGDVVSITDLSARRMSFGSHKNAVRVTLEGRAVEIEGGIEGYEQRLSPSIAWYLYRQQTVVFFYSCVVFLWALLWGAKNTLSANK